MHNYVNTLLKRSNRIPIFIIVNTIAALSAIIFYLSNVPFIFGAIVIALTIFTTPFWIKYANLLCPIILNKSKYFHPINLGRKSSPLINKIDEERILDGIIHYDNMAWENFIDLYGKLIYYSIHKIACRKRIEITEHDLEDIYQDFLLSLLEKDFKKLRSFRFKDSLKTYLTILASHFTLIWINKGINKPSPQPLAARYEKVQNIIESLRDQGLAPDENFEEKEIEEIIQKFTERLDHLNKDIFTLYFIKGKSPKEIISIKGISVGTIYKKINDLKKEFLKIYKNDNND